MTNFSQLLCSLELKPDWFEVETTEEQLCLAVEIRNGIKGLVNPDVPDAQKNTAGENNGKQGNKQSKKICLKHG